MVRSHAALVPVLDDTLPVRVADFVVLLVFVVTVVSLSADYCRLCILPGASITALL